MLVECLRSHHGRYISNLDLSNNPLTNDSSDVSALEALLEWAANSIQLFHLFLDNVEGVPPQIMHQLQQSMMVNRAVANTNSNTDYFSKFAAQCIEAKAAGHFASYVELESQDLHEVDVNFVRLNKLDLCTVGLEKNRIVLKRRVPQTKPTSVGF